MSETAIIDSGGANLASLLFALERLGSTGTVTTDRQVIMGAARVILPGVGAAGDAMRRLRLAGLDRLLPELSQPVLGICLGMQLLFKRSEEGQADGLGVLPDTVQRLRAEPGRPVPHMGWNRLQRLRDDPLMEGIRDQDYVYFVHSYAVQACDSTVATTDYGERLSAVVRQGNFWGAQFHPERSGAAGARVLANFLSFD